ncbi:hypothetical protein [Agathobaculum sp.]|uniref:hypothetical protein n=1 Tax=Agathobaculum sp. TaxID=2048138 RepID=UPI002A81D179|nr:hypothetical protein [Agathobaculum sp.]MDY3617819.1 hypothetical protein [Agathobaculum sp.]
MRLKVRGILLSLLALIVFAGLLAFGAGWVGVRADRTADDVLDDVRRAAVYCYAVEGRYPPDLAYLTAQYGVRYDTHRFYVFYQPFAANLMPDITVVEAEEAAA